MLHICCSTAGGVDSLFSLHRPCLQVKFTSNVKLSEGGGGAGGVEYGRDEEENFFKRLGPQGFQERLAASQEAMKNKNVVNLTAIRQGMKRFQFLLNCCEPGTIPDASILAAALDLEAPSLLFLECARFVHRCNRGNWPEWMKGHHVNITKRGLSRGRSPVVGNKRNQKLQWNAAKHFCQWGDAIGTRLSELCHSDSESPANILGFIYDEETKRRLRKEDEEEDYLDDNTVNPTKCGCPFALKMAACQLLLEITTFLRETFPCLPRPRTEPQVDLESCRLRLDPELSHHRYERKISFAGILDDEDGHDSLNSSSHTLKSDTACDDKKSQEPLDTFNYKTSKAIKNNVLVIVKKNNWVWVFLGGKTANFLQHKSNFLQFCTFCDHMLSGGPTTSPKPPKMGCVPHGGWWPQGTCPTCLFGNPALYVCALCKVLPRCFKPSVWEHANSLQPSQPTQVYCSTMQYHNNTSYRPTAAMQCYQISTSMLMLTLACCGLSPQVMSLSPAPLSLLIKAAPILTEDMYADVQPAAWELLLSVDEHMAAAAAAMFLLCAVKVPDAVTEMMMAEFQHAEASQRINSVFKFYTLWRFRYQVWPRMEEGAQQIFKIPPPSINFTLPSPILGMPCVPMFDPPWVPSNTGSVQDPINEDNSVSPAPAACITVQSADTYRIYNEPSG
ncbi:unnamed protein product [Oncorhynchus mykiss]|uniref:Protein UNC80 central region domain-containing protein n=1 Tax=Oncorhynchus mykiss TaxID=8022 RepID=A0A060YLJ0_ONCMY|nr:unnamed protein product [Oncorhynchus mykiss]